ncbi:hypothetical protein P168DRAFT_339963 [Aspergillus campestris IBT 28561]|uniref:GPI anchored protein n=1 Tax=Aspergillus campestris (strain IBT 28561) TaxID=1392248 RepID=A0A2I1D9V8_ASPC2|nr:uncharacterized protein P168DRAFT_339963 [Aspergillus campestris IBT 28561]PKY06665.1 hypothetical protein P168DRAFT_339963 [Aspergillus campestris IBT 28561]
MVFFCLGLVVSLVGFSPVEAKAHFNEGLQPLEFPQARRLSAASSPARLQARADSPQVVLSNTASFDYLHDGDDSNVESVFAATVDVASHLPIFFLEDVDAHMEDVSCSESHIQLVFESIDTMYNVKGQIESTGDFIIVTAHSGCDPEGERSTHRVTKATFDPDRQLATFEKTRCTWQEAFHSTEVSFSRIHHSSIQKRSHTLAKRQEPHPTTTGSHSATETKFTPTISFPSVTATTPLASTATKSLNEHYNDRQIWPPDLPGADQIGPEGVTVSCKACSLEGEIEITKGSFRVSDSNDLSEMSDTIAFLDHGSIEIVAKKLAAQVQLGLDFVLTQPLISLNMTLPTIPLTPFETKIPGALAFGPLIEPHLSFGVSAVEEIGFSFGFNVSVPDNSNIMINMTDFSNSSISGFDETTFHTLPFESTLPLVSLITSVSFTPQILLGISTAKGLVSGGIGAFLELPKLALNITQLSDVDEKCEPSSKDTDSPLDSLFESLTNFIPSVDVNMGVLADFGVDMGKEPQSVAVQTVVTSTSYPLPTLCLQFDPDEKTFAVPTPLAKVASGKAVDGEGEGEKGDAGRVGPGMVSVWALVSLVLGLCFF